MLSSLGAGASVSAIYTSIAIGGVLYALQLDDDILSLAKDDELGRALQDMNLPQRERASKKE